MRRSSVWRRTDQETPVQSETIWNIPSKSRIFLNESTTLLPLPYSRGSVPARPSSSAPPARRRRREQQDSAWPSEGRTGLRTISIISQLPHSPRKLLSSLRKLHRWTYSCARMQRSRSRVPTCRAMAAGPRNDNLYYRRWPARRIGGRAGGECDRSLVSRSSSCATWRVSHAPVSRSARPRHDSG